MQALRGLPIPAGTEVWCKREDRVARPYGGNKVRKLEYLLGAAIARRAAILTIGAIIAAGARMPASSDQCTIYHWEGASASDLFVASWAHDWACAQGVGQRFQFS